MWSCMRYVSHDLASSLGLKWFSNDAFWSWVHKWGRRIDLGKKWISKKARYEIWRTHPHKPEWQRRKKASTRCAYPCGESERQVSKTRNFLTNFSVGLPSERPRIGARHSFDESKFWCYVVGYWGCSWTYHKWVRCWSMWIELTCRQIPSTQGLFPL